MNIILMRSGRSVTTEEFDKVLSGFVATYKNVKFVTGSSTCYENFSDAARKYNFLLHRIPCKYDPVVTVGHEKVEWVFQSPSSRGDKPCRLDYLYYSTAADLTSVLNDEEEYVLVFYFDMLMLEIINCIISGANIEHMRRSSIYLDEMCVAVIDRNLLLGMIHCLTIKVNVAIESAFSVKPFLRLV